MITTVLFDLDGTLLPMDNEEFTRTYFKYLCARLAPYGYDPKELVDGIWAGTAAMVKNDGSRSNEDAFWARFAEVMGDRVYSHREVLEDFYRNEFNRARSICGYNPAHPALVRELKQRGYRVVLATNPIFPSFATENRIRWAGLEPEEFELYTTYENFSYCKPNPAYYQEILRRIGCTAEECLMVGNDATEDMVAETLGMQVYLLTDNLINKADADISRWPHGSIDGVRTLLGLD